MQRSDIASNFDNRRADPNDDLFGTSQLNAAYNEFGRYAIDKLTLPEMEVSASVSYVDGTVEYALSAISADFKDPIQVFYDSNNEFTHVNVDDFRRLSSQSVNIFANNNRTLYLKTSFGSASLRLDYYSSFASQTSGGTRERSMSDDTSEPIFHDDSMADVYNDWALMRMKQMEGGQEKMNEASSLFKSIQLKLDELNGPSRKSVPLVQFGSVLDKSFTGQSGFINNTQYIP